MSNIIFTGLPPSSCIFVRMLPFFLALQDAPGSYYIFLAPALDSVISPRSSGFFYYKEVPLFEILLFLCILYVSPTRTLVLKKDFFCLFTAVSPLPRRVFGKQGCINKSLGMNE